MSQKLIIDSLAKGLNTFDPANNMPKGFYVDAQNMLLTNKTPVTIGGLTRLNTTPAPRDEAVVWFEPFSTATGTHILAATDAGTLYKYEVSEDTWTQWKTGLDTDALTWSHVPFRGTLIFSNGVDPILKYDGDDVLPVGGKRVAFFKDTEPWRNNKRTGGGVLVSTNLKDPEWADQHGLVRHGTQSLKLYAGQNMSLVYDEAQNFVTGVNGGSDFAATDLFKMWVYKAPTAQSGNITIRFLTSDADRFATDVLITEDGWTQVELARSAFGTTASPAWDNITKFQVHAKTGTVFFVDDAWWEYLIKPPAGTLVELYNQQLVVAGIADDPTALVYSDAGTPDEVPETNIARFSGGRHALEKVDRITSLYSYFDELIVGKVNSAWTFSGTGTNVSISALPLTIGVDSHHGVVETPWSLHFCFENNIFGARLTSRGIVSSNINSLLTNLDGDNLDKMVAIRHDRSHTVRWSFRTNAASGENDLGLLYDYQLDGWLSRYTPHIRYYTRGTVDGNREVLCAMYDGYIRRCDVGTDFDGTPIESYVTLPWMQSDQPEGMDRVVRWLDMTCYTSGTATVLMQARFADEPHEFATASWETFGTVTATPDGDKGFCYLGRTSRWIQTRFKAEALAFELMMPIVISHEESKRRV